MEGNDMYKLEVKISQDKLTAEIILHTDAKQISIEEQEIRDALQRNGVTYGIIESAIRQLCDNPNLFVNQPVEVAVGIPPIDGTDARIEYTFLENMSDQVRPKELEDGRVDYYTVTTIANVTKGQLLAQKIPAQPGTPGMAVTGEPIAPRQGKEVVIKPGKNVLLNQDRTLLYAAIDGQVSFTDHEKVNVFPVYEVKGDVDFGVGNIDFVGTVVIRGSVPTGFRIKASGDIRVLGSVEGAELEAGGSVEIKNGIVAQDKGHVIAGMNVITSFIQNGNVTAGRDVLVSQSIMFSHVRAGRDVMCNGAKGIIIGGTIQAGERIVARVIGNSNATPTALEVGVKPELRAEMAEITKELQNIHENLRKTDQGLSVLDQILQTTGELSQEKKILQLKLTNTRLILDKELKRLEQRRKEVEEQLAGESPAVVDVYSMMYPGIKLVFGRLVRFINQEMSRTRFMVLDGEIRTATLL
ncbi:DUF342 domain-containing protein [Brevibacillus sp. SYP-B805]|uniref:DUF342 domain-containing protein n=1 Tax=Brevibacillus sp. SYP-B805 TaxID=1578199 RepID=UPI0013EA4331|nr:FapA family protein [Brevibacillus sp. SYP-B805]NGQ94034.1 DUF342 domain-containing protein [Brevibacillus sp. SYP-B805]